MKMTLRCMLENALTRCAASCHDTHDVPHPALPRCAVLRCPVVPGLEPILELCSTSAGPETAEAAVDAVCCLATYASLLPALAEAVGVLDVPGGLGVMGTFAVSCRPAAVLASAQSFHVLRVRPSPSWRPHCANHETAATFLDWRGWCEATT